MKSTKVIELLQNTFYLFIFMLIYGILAKIQKYPNGMLLGNIGVIGVLLTKFIPFFFQFRQKNWKLSILNYADIALWIWVIFGAFTFINRQYVISRSISKNITFSLLLIALSCYFIHLIRWFYNKVKGKNDAQHSDYEK